MRYVIVSVVKGKAGEFNNNLRKDVYEKFGAKSSKLPAHFTIKSPFEAENINELDIILNKFCINNKAYSYKILGFDHFDDRVVYMKVNMSKKGKMVHDNLIDEISKLNFINFLQHDGKNKIFHVTITSKKIQPIFNETYTYVNSINCKFDCLFDNISVFKWINNTWVLHKEYLLK